MLIGSTWAALACLYLGVGCFGTAPEPLLVISGPSDLVHFELRDARGETLWAVHAKAPQTLAFIAYGVVPTGFVQQSPGDGSPPRPLRLGEILTSETRSTRRVFIHRGQAGQGGRFSIHDWSMHLLEPPASDPTH